MPGPTICIVDIETDGPLTGVNSMLALGAVAFDNAGTEIGAFQRNIAPLPDASADPQTAHWWRTQPEAWAAITRDPSPFATAMADFVAWVDGLPRPRLYAAYPLIFDGAWVDWYLRRFTASTLCDPFREGALFAGTGIDIPTYVQTAMGLPNTTRRANYPAEIMTRTVCPHDPVSDARAHGALYFNARRKAILG